MSNALENETPTLSKVLRDAIESRLAEVHVSLPAEIVSFDGIKADVQPLLKRKYIGKSPESLPVITNVPVIWPQTKDGGFRMPLEPGMTGTLIFSERSLDTWLVQGGAVSPEDPRKFSLSDAQFIPGLMPQSVDPEHDKKALVARYKGTKLRLEQSLASVVAKKITLGSDTSAEALVLGNTLKTYLSALETEITAISTDLSTLTTLFTTLVTALAADVATPGTPPLIAVAPATAGAAPALPAGAAALTAAIAANTAARAIQKATSLDTPTTNILSQLSFTERGGT